MVVFLHSPSRAGVMAMTWIYGRWGFPQAFHDLEPHFGLAGSVLLEFILLPAELGRDHSDGLKHSFLHDVEIRRNGCLAMQGSCGKCPRLGDHAVSLGRFVQRMNSEHRMCRFNLGLLIPITPTSMLMPCAD